MHRAPFVAGLSFVLTLLPVHAGAQSNALRPQTNVVHEAEALPYQVHIVPTSQPEGSSSIETGGDSWAARGYDLRTLIAQVFDVDARRIEFPDGPLAGKRFDISINLPVQVDDETMQRLLADAVQKQFGLRIAPESRTMDVYVLTAPHGPGAAMKHHVAKMGAEEIAGFGGSDTADDDLSKITVFGQDCTDKGSTTGISVEASTMSDFRRTLEPDLDRVLVDETHLTGSFDFTVSKYANQQELFQRLHDELGLVVTPAERSVTVLTVRPAEEKPQTIQARS